VEQKLPCNAAVAFNLLKSKFTTARTFLKFQPDAVVLN
jgi:hypothetical protein